MGPICYRCHFCLMIKQNECMSIILLSCFFIFNMCVERAALWLSSNQHADRTVYKHTELLLRDVVQLAVVSTFAQSNVTSGKVICNQIELFIIMQCSGHEFNWNLGRYADCFIYCRQKQGPGERSCFHSTVYTGCLSCGIHQSMTYHCNCLHPLFLATLWNTHTQSKEWQRVVLCCLTLSYPPRYSLQFNSAFDAFVSN